MKLYDADRSALVSPQEWNHFAQASGEGRILQSWTWGELKGSSGWQPMRLAAVESDRLVAGVQVLFRRLPLGMFTIAYVPRGPLGDRSILASPDLHRACHQRRALSLLIEPDWPDAPADHDWLLAHGYRHRPLTVQPRRTVVLDLRLDDEQLLGQMKPKTRYNIRLAQRRGVTARLGDSSDLPVFYELLQRTSQRDGFGIHTRDYYAQAWELFHDQGAAGMFLAEYQDRAIAGLMVFAWGKRAYYMYGASADEERHRMPTYLVQWQAMRWARASGCHTYDLWGIPDVDEAAIGTDMVAAEESGALSTGMGGLYRFKRGFGGSEIRYLGAYEYPYNALLSQLLRLLWQRRAF